MLPEVCVQSWALTALPPALSPPGLRSALSAFLSRGPGPSAGVPRTCPLRFTVLGCLCAERPPGTPRVCLASHSQSFGSKGPFTPSHITEAPGELLFM